MQVRPSLENARAMSRKVLVDRNQDRLPQPCWRLVVSTTAGKSVLTVGAGVVTGLRSLLSRRWEISDSCSLAASKGCCSGMEALSETESLEVRKLLSELCYTPLPFKSPRH